MRGEFREQTHLEAHDVAEEHEVARVDAEAVRVHRVVDLADDGLARRLDAEHLLDFHDVVGRRQVTDDTCGRAREGGRELRA